MQNILKEKLDKETYRDLDTGMFKLRDYGMENISDEDLQEIDITQNYLNYLGTTVQYTDIKLRVKMKNKLLVEMKTPLNYLFIISFFVSL